MRFAKARDANEGEIVKASRKGRPKLRHGHTRGYRSPTYSSWSAMVGRTQAPSCRDGYAFGVAVDPRWLGVGGFEAFLADMGERPAGMTLDRVQNSLGYSKANCRWATKATQSRNRTIAKLEAHEPGQIRWLIAGGAKQRDVARFFGVSEAMVSLIKSGKKWAS